LYVVAVPEVSQDGFVEGCFLTAFDQDLHVFAYSTSGEFGGRTSVGMSLVCCVTNVQEVRQLR
jgi:hypothetical protein